MEAYLSGLRLIFLFCGLLGAEMIPANPQTAWRLASIVSNDNSLKVYLAAWRKAHILMGFGWPCESCAVLRDIKHGIRNLMAPRLQRPCIRALRLRCLIATAVAQRAPFRAASYCFAYQFLLRVPNELLRQFKPCMFTIEPGTNCVRVGPLQRKTERNAYVMAPCICNSGGRIACAHVWASWLLRRFEASSSKLVFFTKYETFVRELRADLISIDVPSAEANLVGSHAFRHGAARDILQTSGLKETMKRGGWRGKGILHYTPRSEIECRLMSELWEGLSDDESS